MRRSRCDRLSTRQATTSPEVYEQSHTLVWMFPMPEVRKKTPGRRTLPSNTPPNRRANKVSTMRPSRRGYASTWRGAGHTLRLEAAQSKTHDDMETMTRAWAAYDSDTTLSLGPKISRETSLSTLSVYAAGQRGLTFGHWHRPLSLLQWDASMKCSLSSGERTAGRLSV